MRRKAFVSILETIAAIIIIFTAFGVFFPGFSYKNRWSEALLLLKGRDAVLTIDRIGKIYQYSFDPNLLRDFLDTVFYKESIITWSETEGTMKNNITVACNCTSEQITNLTDWTSDENRIMINGRYIDVIPVYTNLENIASSDVLLIWSYQNLSNYKTNLEDYIEKGNGIVEIMDFDDSFLPSGDSVQTKIFGIIEKSPGQPKYGDDDTNGSIVKPTTISNDIYQSYKTYVNGLSGSLILEKLCGRPLPGPGNRKIIQSDGETSKMLVNTIDGEATCVVLNGTSKIAWMADFTNRRGLDETTIGNHVKMLKSLLLAASNKRAVGVLSPELKTGYMTSYVNVNNTDMFEVYRFNLGMGYPF